MRERERVYGDGVRERESIWRWSERERDIYTSWLGSSIMLFPSTFAIITSEDWRSWMASARRAQEPLWTRLFRGSLFLVGVGESQIPPQMLDVVLDDDDDCHSCWQ